MIDLDAIEEQARWSSWSRVEASKVVLSLVAELRAMRLTGRELAAAIKRIEHSILLGTVEGDLSKALDLQAHHRTK